MTQDGRQLASDDPSIIFHICLLRELSISSKENEKNLKIEDYIN